MENYLESKTNLIVQEYQRLTRQVSYFLPGNDHDSISIHLQEGLCPQFCWEIAKSKVGNGLCMKKRQALISSAIERREPAVAICHAGLFEIMAPVYDGTDLAGMLNAAFAPLKLPENIRQQINLYQKKYASPGETLLPALNQIAQVDENAIHSFASLLGALVTINIQAGTNGNDGSMDLEASLDELDDLGLIENLNLNKSLSMAIEAMKDIKYGYQAIDDIMQILLTRIYHDIRIGKLVKAKETYKVFLDCVYREENMGKAKYAAHFMIFRMNDNFLRKISFHWQVYSLTERVFEEISRAGSIHDLRSCMTDYFDGMSQIYQIKDQNQNAIINRIVEFVNDNYWRPFTIKDMVKTLNVSASYASRTFSDHMGVSIKSYINETRMYHAQYLFRYTNLPVSTVAERVGYTDIRSFYKMFEKHFGITSTQLRRLFIHTPEEQEAQKP